MRAPSRHRPFSWLLIPLAAAAFMIWAHWIRADRLDRVSRLPGWSVDAPQPEAGSATGWQDDRRNLLLAPPLEDGRKWIAQAQQMLSAGEGRIRHVDYDNAPFGRASFAPSAYGWWLAGLAWADHRLTGAPPGGAVERTALYANPLLHALLLLGTLPFVARRLGPAAAMLFAVGLTMLYPLAGGFAPGLPGPRALALACLIWSILPILALGLRDDGTTEAAAPRRARLPFVVAGLAGACGLWLDVTAQLPTVLGLAAGALVAAGLSRGRPASDPLLAPSGWRLWGLSQGLGAIALFAADFMPGGLAFHPEVLHPLHGLTALGLGELLALVLPWIAGHGRPAGWRAYTRLALAVSALAAAPAAMIRAGTTGFTSAHLDAFNLSNLPPALSAPHLGAWLADAGFGAPTCAALLPLLAVGAAAAVLWRRLAARRAVVALALGPVAISAVLACRYLSHFSQLDCALLLAAVTIAAAFRTGASPLRDWATALACLLLLVPGACLLVPGSLRKPVDEVTDTEMQGILERDLAHWLSARAADRPPVVLAPPDLAAALGHYGGVRVVGSLAWENEDGFSGAIRIARASTWEEALALIQRRGVTHLVLPSWNRLLDGFATTGAATDNGDRYAPENFLFLLRHWKLPPWLQPVAYHIPSSARMTGESVAVFAVVEDQDEPLAAARLAEYFVESSRMQEAAALRDQLRQFPGDLGALAALAQVQAAIGDKEGLAASLGAIQALLPTGVGADLPWDRRFSLAIVLVLSRHNDLAQPLFAACLAEVDPAKLRGLSPSALMRLLALAKLFRLDFPDPKLRASAIELLPPALRARI